MFAHSRSSRHHAVTLLIGIGLAATVIPAARADNFDQAVLALNPLAYFNLDSVNESSAVNGFTTTFNAGAAVTAPGGGAPILSDPNNAGLALNGVPDTSGYGTGQSVTTSLGAANPMTEGTILGWFNLTQLTSTGGVSSVEYVAGRSQSTNDLDLQVNGDNELHFYTSNAANIVDPTALTANTWYFFAATFNESPDLSDLYVDGTLVGSASGTVSGTKSSTFTIGDSDVFNPRNFDGTIDDVALYNTPLTASQISTIYNSSFTPAGTAVPEASSLALAILGFLPMGLLARKRLRRA